MHPAYPRLFALLAAARIAIPASGMPAVDAVTPAGASTSFAVVELFTSEGCSSCPPADRLLSELSEEADHAGRPVYLLSFHVDYWNYLGWADPFSREEFSKRQERYAAALQGRVYTPQMILNGGEEFVGSEARTARRRIDAALIPDAPAKRGSAVSLAIGILKAGNPRILEVTYRAGGHRAGALLSLAVVEKGLSVPVRHGENGGRTLRHDNVVRAFATVALDAGGRGTARIEVPEGVRMEKASLIAYAQDARSLHVLGAWKSPALSEAGSGAK